MAVSSAASVPGVRVLLKEELKRFQCELKIVRTSLESESVAHKHVLLSDLSSDCSDWEEGQLDQEVGRRERGASRSLRAVEDHRQNVYRPAPSVADSVVSLGGFQSDWKFNAPDELPTRQRPKQSLGEKVSSRCNLMLQHAENVPGPLSPESEQRATVSAAAAFPNPNLDVIGLGWQSIETTVDGATPAIALGEEDAMQQGNSFGPDGPADLMAFKIQQLLEGRRSNLDWTSIVSMCQRAPPMPLPGAQGRGEWSGAVPSPDGSHQRLTRRASVQGSESAVGSEEAQAYLARVLASLLPPQRLVAVTSTNEPSIQVLLEGAEGFVDPGKDECNGSLGSGIEKDNLSGTGSGKKPSQEKRASIVEGGVPLSHDPKVQSAPLLAGQTGLLSDHFVAPSTSQEFSQQIFAPFDEISEPAPRSKLLLLPSMRGAAVKKPMLLLQTLRQTQGLSPEGGPAPLANSLAGASTDESSGDGELRAAAGSATGPVDANHERLTASHAPTRVPHQLLHNAPNAVSATHQVQDEKAEREQRGGRRGQVASRESESIRSDMEERMRVLEMLQLRTLELQEQKLEREIELQRRRAEMQWQSHGLGAMSLVADAAGVRAGGGQPSPLTPATLLLTQAREAAQEVVKAVGKLESTALPATQASSHDPAGPSAPSQELATAVTHLKEMLDKKLGEFYTACASFHAASLQGAAQLAQAAQGDVNTLDGGRRAAAAHAMARQTAELDGLRQQVRGSHQLALHSPAFRLHPESRPPVPTQPPSRARSRSSTASQASKRGPQDVASAAAELASGLRQLPSGTDPPPSQWPGLESAVEEAVAVAEGHGLERQLLQHAAHARWRDLAAREEERAQSAKAAVHALLGSAFDYEAARKELDLIARAAEGVPERAKERAKDPAFQALAYASATQKQLEGWEGPQSRHFTAQQAEEALFLEKLRQDVDRRIAAAAALSTGMNIGAKRRRVREPLGESLLTNKAGRLGQLPADPSQVLGGRVGSDGEPGNILKEAAQRRIPSEENVPLSGERRGRSAESDVRSRGLRKQEQKPVTLKKVEVAFGHKVEPPKPPLTRPVRKRKESGDHGWVKRMSAPRRPAQSPEGGNPEGSRREREPRTGEPKRSTLRPAEMVHRPSTAVRWPSPEPRRPTLGEAVVEARRVEAGSAVWDSDDPVGRLMALAREAAAGVSEYAERLMEPVRNGPVDVGSRGVADSPGAIKWPGPCGTDERLSRAGEGSAEGTAQAITEWLSDQVVSTLLRQPRVLDGLATSNFGPLSVGSGGTEPGEFPAVEGRQNDDLSRRPVPFSGDVSIDEEVVRTLAAAVVGEEVARVLGEQWGVEQGKGSAAVQAERRDDDEEEEEEGVGSADRAGSALGPNGGRAEGGTSRGEVGTDEQTGAGQTTAGTGDAARPLVSAVERDGGKGDGPPGSVSPQQAGGQKGAKSLEPSHLEAPTAFPTSSGGFPRAADRGPAVNERSNPPISHFQIPSFLQQRAGSTLGMHSVYGPNQAWPFMPLPLYVLPDGRIVQLPFPLPPTPVADSAPITRRGTAAQTEPQTLPQPKPVKVRSRKKNADSPATPPTPSTPSSSPEVTLVSRRNVRRGFEAAVEGMGISVRLDLESDTGVTAMDRPKSDTGNGDGFAIEHGMERVSTRETDAVELDEQAGKRAVERPTDQESTERGGSNIEGGAPGRETDLASGPPNEADAGATPPSASAAESGTHRQGSPRQDTSQPQEEAPADKAGDLERSPGRARRKWAFLDSRRDARLAVDTMAASVILEGAEETSSRSGGGSTSGRSRGSASNKDSTSVSFGEVVADLTSEPSTAFDGRPSGPQADAPQKSLQENAATCSLSEGEAEPGDLCQDQEPGQRGPVALPELSTDSEPGLIRQSMGSKGVHNSTALHRDVVEQEDVESSSASLDATFVRSRHESVSRKRGGRVRFRRPTPHRGVVSNAVATLRSLAKVRAAADVSEGERESGAEEGEMGFGAKEAGQRD